MFRKLFKDKNTLLTWREPIAFRIRLRGDLFVRMLIAVGVWLAGTGFLFAFRWLTAARASELTLLGLGVVPGLCALCCLLMMHGQISGTVDLRKKEIFRLTAAYAVFAIRTIEERTPLNAIHRCTIYPGKSIDQSFTVMRITGPEFDEIIGIPQSTSAKDVATLLHDRGISPQRGDELPEWATRPLTGIGPVVSLTLGVVMLTGGLWLHLKNPANPNPLREPPAFFRPNAPAPVPAPAANPAPVNPPPLVAVPKPQLTEVVGGAGGIPFRRADPLSRPVLAVRFHIGDWAGAKRVTLLKPVFTSPPPGSPGTVVAKEGYALGAIQVSATDFVNGVTLEFMRLRADGSVDPTDSYRAEPIGAVTADAKVLSGSGRPVIGFHGKSSPGAISALGLVLLEK